MLSPRSAALALAALLAACAPSPDGPWRGPRPALEAPGEGYERLRGLVYLPSYSASSVGVWSRYDREVVEREMALVRRLGANAIRTWLNAWSFDDDPAAFLAAFGHFLGTAERNGLWVMPVLFDSCFPENEPSERPWDDVDAWVPNPGKRFVDDAAAWARFDPYVEAVVAAGREVPNLLMWDVMNEPWGEGVDPWLVHWIERVRELDPDHPLTISWNFTLPWMQSAPMVDVVGFHPYGLFRENVDAACERARAFAAENGGLPILVTEAGIPGHGSRYEDVLRHLDGAGVGFFLFEALVHAGAPEGYAFRHTSGMVYTDGEARDAVAAHAFRNLALERGARAGAPFVVKDEGKPHYLPEGPLPAGVGGPEIAALFLDWDRYYGRPPFEALSRKTFAWYPSLLTWVYSSLGWMGALDPVEGLAKRKDLAALEEDWRAGRAEEAEARLVELAREAGRLLEAAGVDGG